MIRKTSAIVDRKIVCNGAVFSLLLLLAVMAPGQSSTSASAQGAVPRLVRFGGILHDPEGNARTGVVSVMFSIYPDQVGSAPLWSETQNVTLDSQGRYTVLLGSEHAEGLSTDLFGSGEGRWLGVQVMAPGEPEQPRVLLVSVPYAMKAGDAQTLGGLPPTAFLLAQPATVKTGGSNSSQRAFREASSPTLGSPTGVMTTGGTANMLSKFSDASTIVDSTIFESNGRIGIGTTTPDSTLTLVGSGNADPLWHAIKTFVGDNAQFANLLWFEGEISFSADGS
ncbi:MAG: hypothetical protein JWO20_1535, partial [Candidatus Angelobacter sp.]|nr:hypothetical protein [Candidatus Angelobacter sp.]